MAPDPDRFDGAIDYDAAEEAYLASYDPDTEPPSAVIVEVVAAIEGNDPAKLDSLAYADGPDALDTVIRSATARDESDIRFEFTEWGYEITVTSGGRIRVRPANGFDDGTGESADEGEE